MQRYVHLTPNDVLLRFRLYLASNIVLVVLWSAVFVALVTSGRSAPRRAPGRPIRLAPPNEVSLFLPAGVSDRPIR